MDITRPRPAPLADTHGHPAVRPSPAERAFRRGYQQGVEQALAAARSGAPLARLEAWADRVQQWRNQPSLRPDVPPAP